MFCAEIMNDNASAISVCDNLEIENYLKSCGCFPKNTGVKMVDGHNDYGFGCGGSGSSRSSRDVGSLIEYSKCMLNRIRNDLRESEPPDIDKHIIIEKEKLNELLKSKIEEYIRNHPLRDDVKQIQAPTKIVHFHAPKPKPLVHSVRRIKSFDRHINCVGNQTSAKPALVSRKSQQINENKIKSLRIGRNIIVDPIPVTSYYPRRIFNDTKPESFRSTWHDRLMGLDSATSSKCTIVTTTTTSQVIKKSEIKVLRYNFDWGGMTDAAPNETVTGDKNIQNIDQTTQTESNVVTTKSVACFTEQLCEIDMAPVIGEQPPIIEPSVVQVSSHETNENTQVTVGSSFVYEYESTFDETDSDSNSDSVSELSETIKPAPISSMLPVSRKPNILLETVVYADKTLEQRDAEIQTDFVPVQKTSSPKEIEKMSANDVNDRINPQRDVELELSRLDEEILQDKFKLLSVLRQSSPSQEHKKYEEKSMSSLHQPSEIQLPLTPLKPRDATNFMPSPLELSSIRPLSLAHKNSTFDVSNEKYWKTINQIQMEAARNPFSPKPVTNDIAKRAAEKFLKSTNTRDGAAEPTAESNSISSSGGSNVMLITASSSEYESDSTGMSRRYVQRRQFSYSGKLSEGEVLSLGEVE